MTIRSDNPISRAEDDTLGRNDLAVSVVSQIQKLDASQGAVIGILGPWGSGKTSLINLVKGELDSEDIPVLDFNPWMFSGTHQLMQAFFTEISAQLKLKSGNFKAIGEDLEKYGEALSGLGWVPLVGPWVERGRLLMKSLGRLSRRPKQSVLDKRNIVAGALEKLKKPLVIIIDDIDRLSTPEIRDIFRLVRLTANFSNVIYVLSFDRLRVEKALDEDGIPGRDYLEKILQIGIDLPVVPNEVFNKQILSAISESVDHIVEKGPFDEESWPDIYYEIIRPLIKNMRDVRRYAMSINGTVANIGKDVALQDVLALEAIRVFLPDVYTEICNSVEGLTKLSSDYGRDDPPRLKESIEEILTLSGDNKTLIENLIRRVFPTAERHIGNMHYGIGSQRQWLRNRRVAHESILRLYIERQVSREVSTFNDSEKAFRMLSDPKNLKQHLDSLKDDRKEDVIAALENFEDGFTPEAAAASIPVLLNIGENLPEKTDKDMFSFDARMVVGRVVYRLVKKFGDATRTEAAVIKILPELTSASAKYELISTVGYREGVGHKLIDKRSAAQLEDDLKDEIRSLSALSLSREKEVLRLLLFVNEAQTGSAAFIPPAHYKLTHAILSSSRSEVKRNTIGTRSVTTSYRLAWDILVNLFGSEELLKHRVEAARARYLDQKELYELFDKYASGWRPGADD